MTAEKRIALTVDVLRALAQNQKQDQKIIDSIISDPAKWEYVSFPGFGAAAALLNDAYTELARKSGSPIAALKRIAKESTRDDMRGVWTDQAGRSCVCSGYHGVRISDPVAGIPQVPGIDLDRLFVPGTESLDLPTLAELKATIAASGAKRSITDKRRYLRITDTITVDCFLLLDMLEALPGARATYTPKTSSTRDGKKFQYGPIYFSVGNDDGILMPVRP